MPPRFRRALILLTLSLIPFAPARAGTVIWQAAPNSPGNWLDPANWSTGILPTSADTAQVKDGGQVQLSSGVAAASSLQLAPNVGDVTSLSLTGGQLTATNAYVGYSGTASVLQSDGTFTGSTLYLANGSKSAGSYTLQGSGTLSFPTEYIGRIGPAFFTQAGGNNYVTNLYLAFGSSATYTLTDGFLSAGNAIVGYSGNATFTQSGGMNRIVSGGAGGTLNVGYEPGSSGTYNLLGNGFLSTYYLYVGANLGSPGNAPGFFNLSGNASLDAMYEYVGSYGLGTFVHTSGVNHAKYLYVGASNAPGSYTLGDAALLSAEYLDVTNGSFKQTGGTVLLDPSVSYATDTLSLAHAAQSNASYSISGPTSSLSTNGAVHLAYGTSSTAVFTQSGGAVSTNSQPLYLAEGATGSFASYTLSSGSLATGAQYIGHTGTGTFDQSGGTNRAGTLYLGYASNATSPSNGSYSLSNNAQLLSAAQYHANGTSSRSTFTQSGGTNDLGTNPLYLAYGANSSATYTFSAGSLFSGNQFVGYAGTATFTHTGGTNDLDANTLSLGSNSSTAKGVYLLTGPDATLLAGSEDIGPGGSPSLFRQTAGANSTGTLTVRANSRYELSGGSLQVTSPLTNSGTLDLLAGSCSTLSLVNNGTLTLAAPATLRAPTSPTLASVTGTGSTTVTAGATLRAAYLQQSALTVAGTVQLSSPLTTSTLSSLTLSPGSRLDLTTNTLRLSSGPSANTSQIRQYLHDGLLLSSTADSDPLNLLALGYLFDPAAKTITIKTTPLGDANLDGKLTTDDYALLDQGFAQHLSFWSNGDFDYDGSITSADYLLIDRAFALQSGTLSPTLLAERQSQFGDAYVSELLASVPEPSSVTYLLATLPLLPRRRTNS